MTEESAKMLEETTSPQGKYNRSRKATTGHSVEESKIYSH